MSDTVQSKVDEYFAYDEAVKYGCTHALWKALDDNAPLEVLLGIVNDKERGFGGATGVSKGTKYTPLHCASQRGNVALARVLIAEGCNVNAKTYEDFTALDFANHAMRFPELVAELKLHGAKPGSECN